MAAWFWIGLEGLAVAAAVSPIVIGIGSAFVEGSIRPRFIPNVEIGRLADEIMARRPIDPETASLNEEHAAWCRSLSVEQGQWRRVRKEIRRRRLCAIIRRADSTSALS